jgi:hypothetical protein
VQLPCFELDLAFVLPAGTYLGQKTRPAPRIRAYVEAAVRSALLENAVARYNPAHCVGALLDDRGIFGVQRDPEALHASMVLSDVAVTEIQPE